MKNKNDVQRHRRKDFHTVTQRAERLTSVGFSMALACMGFAFVALGAFG